DRLTIATRSGIHHQVDRIQFLAPVVVLEGAEHDVGDLVARMRPDIDDLVVTLTICDDALAILLLDGPDLFVSILELDLFLFRNDHVRNSNRDTGLGRFAEAQFLELIKRLDCSVLASHVVATPDNIAELFLARSLIKEPDVLWPNLIEEHAAGRGLDHARVLVAVNSIATKIGILVSNPVVRSNRSFRHRKFDLNGVRKQWESCVAIAGRSPSRILSEIITAERDV